MKKPIVPNNSMSRPLYITFERIIEAGLSSPIFLDKAFSDGIDSCKQKDNPENGIPGDGLQFHLIKAHVNNKNSTYKVKQDPLERVLETPFQ